MQDFKVESKGNFPGSPRHFSVGKTFWFAVEAPLSSNFRNPAFVCGDLPIGCAQKTGPFDAPFAADGDMATVTWSNLPERLKRMGCGVNFKADA